MDVRSERIARRFNPIIIVATLLVVPVLILEEADVARPPRRDRRQLGDLARVPRGSRRHARRRPGQTCARSRAAEHPLRQFAPLVVLTPPSPARLIQSLRLLRLLRARAPPARSLPGARDVSRSRRDCGMPRLALLTVPSSAARLLLARRRAGRTRRVMGRRPR
jgi:hypothetical protein